MGLNTNDRKQKRRVNQIVRKINKTVASDNQWLGRFVVQPIDFQKCTYEDNSGTYLFYTFEFVDKQTNEVALAIYNSNNMFIEYLLFLAMNNFIVEAVKANPADGVNRVNAPYKIKPMRQVREHYEMYME